MSRKLIIAGNWKLNTTEKEAHDLVVSLRTALVDCSVIDIVVCPPFTHLIDVKELLIDIDNIALGAQNIFWEDFGAFTGEVSGPMLKACGVKYVIIGHSERRQYFGETNETVNKRIKAALKHDLLPIVCIGEVLDERESGKTFDVIKDQLEGGLKDLTPEEMGKIILAYEPVWAIGTGKTATPEQAQEVHKFIRGWLSEKFGQGIAAALRIQYGGSVKPDNAKDLMSQEDIDGALVGGASLKADSFTAIIKNCL